MRSTRGADSGPHQCSVCLRRYKRREHLQRHSSSHTSERPYKCSSCGSAFQRADVLKRHIGTCGGRVIGLSKVTSRRRACDRCVHQKKACDSHQPCRGCSKKAVDCHYSGRLARPNEELKPSEPGILMPFGMSAESEDIATRLNDDESLDPALFNFDSSWEDFLAIPESPLVCRPPSTSADNLDSLHFLDRFTSCTGFVETFDCGTQEQREQVVTKVELEVAYEQHQPELPRETSIGIDIGSTLPQQWLLDPLSLKTHQILLLVKEIVTLKPRNSVVTLEWTPATEEACLKFFSPTNLRRFLELYWAIWHPNVNFVHRPTFNPVSASSTLLAAMAMIGRIFPPFPSGNIVIIHGLEISQGLLFRLICRTMKMRRCGPIVLRRWFSSTTTSTVTISLVDWLRIDRRYRLFRLHIWSVFIRTGKGPMPVRVGFVGIDSLHLYL